MPGSATITVDEKQWAVDVAASPSELSAGLGGLSSIPANTGMLFDLGSPQTVEVTTEPMLFNIDIIFISEGLEVVDVIEDVAPGYLVTEDTPVRYFLEVNAGEAEGIEAGDSVEITDYQYTPPSTISQWMPTIITIAMLGFIAAMVGGMARAALAPPKAVAVCSRCGARIYRTGEKYYDTPAGIFCYRCVPWPYKAPEYEKVCKSPGSPRRLGEPKTEAERRETHERKYGTRETPERGKVGKLEHQSSSGYPVTYEGWEKLGNDIKVKDPASAAEVDRALRYIKLQFDYPQLDDPSMRWKRLLVGKAGELGIKSSVTCPICGEVIEIPEWDKVSRTEALRKHLREKHAHQSDKKLWYLGEWWEEEYSTAECIVYRSADGKKRLYVYWDGTKQVRPVEEEHHSMWLTPEQRKDLQEKYGAVAVRWAEEATRPDDIRGVETAAEHYYKKLKEVFGLGHLSPKLSEEQIRKLREVLGLTASATEVLKIHRETGYIP